MRRKHNGRAGQLTNTTENPPVRRIGDGTPGPGARRKLVREAPKTPAEIHALLYMILDAETMDKMVYSMRKKIAKGNVTALEWIMDRLLGRPAVNVHHDADGALANFMSAWAELANSGQTQTLAIDDASEVIDGIVLAVKNDDNSEDAGTGI